MSGEPFDPVPEFLLRVGDNALILGHRLSEWCGHGPVLEEDIALSNIALDLVGQATLWLELAADREGSHRTADDLAFHRDVLDWRNVLLVEQPNGDFADTIARQFLFDCHHWLMLNALTTSPDSDIAAIAGKAIKEVTYHRRHSGEWLIRLGDGTEESQMRMQAAVDRAWTFTDELFETDPVDLAVCPGADLAAMRRQWDSDIGAVLSEATLRRPETAGAISGGRKGVHTEHLGFLLAEMQFLPRTYPDASW